MEKLINDIVEACMSNPLESLTVVIEEEKDTKRTEISFYFQTTKN